MTNYINQTGFLIAFVAIMLILSGCKPKPEGELGEPFDKVAGMLGTWGLTSFIQTDLNNPVKEERDLTSFFDDGIVTPMEITFKEDRSYSVTIELGRNYFGDNGIWGFDDDDHPTYLVLESLEIDGTPSDTLQYELGAVIRTFDNTMSIEYNRLCGEGATAISTVVYSFNFNRIN